MEILLNGEPRQIPEGITVAALLALLGIEGERVAVELNRAIIRRPAWPAQIVPPGAQVEVVHFVGGG